MAKMFQSKTVHEPTKKGTSIGRKPVLNKSHTINDLKLIYRIVNFYFMCGYLFFYT